LRTLTFAAVVGATLMQPARAQTDLSNYADADGYLDVRKLTYAQLTNTWQRDAGMLTTWHGGGQPCLIPVRHLQFFSRPLTLYSWSCHSANSVAAKTGLSVADCSSSTSYSADCSSGTMSFCASCLPVALSTLAVVIG
jgi:hypothetical protein